MINYILPEFYYLYDVNTTLVKMLKYEPEWFNNNIKISAMYGCFPKQIWNGGRAIINGTTDVDNIVKTIEELNKLDIPVRFTYTNGLINESHLSDYFCNFVTEVAHNGKNEILVNSPILEEYLREKYPNYKYISSATRCIRDIDKLNELIESDKYYLVLGDYRDNFNFDFLGKISDPKKVELLINPYCKRDCKIRELHYKILDRIQLGLPEEEKYPECPCEKLGWFEVESSDTIIRKESLQQYIDMGFNNFKIEGRNVHPMNVIDSYMYYLVKPEYQNQVRNMLIRVHY